MTIFQEDLTLEVGKTTSTPSTSTPPQWPLLLPPELHNYHDHRRHEQIQQQNESEWQYQRS